MTYVNWRLYQNTDAEPTDCVDGSVRLTGESSYRGRLEICRANVSGTVCAPQNTFEHIGFSEASVACQMLGHQSRGKGSGTLHKIMSRSMSIKMSRVDVCTVA